MIEELIRVAETPWGDITHKFESNPSTVEDIISETGLDWEVGAEPISSESFEKIPNYSVAYRKDTNAILGLIRKESPQFVQNIDTFKSFASVLGDNLKVVTAAAVGKGEKIFGCFEIPQCYKALDDDVKQYLVLVNDHLKGDNKITVINTPIRVVCQNALNTALSRSYVSTRVEVSEDPEINENIAKQILEITASAQMQLSAKAENMYGKKLSDKYIENFMDEMFPVIESSATIDEDSHKQANDMQEMMRDTFYHHCLLAPNLLDYKNTEWALYNAIVDYTQHYYKKADDSVNLTFRMGSIGVGSNTNISFLNKYLKIKDKIAS